MSDQPLTVGAYYATMLLRQWETIGELGKQYRERMLAADLSSPETREVIRRYLATMTHYWGELRVKVEDRNDETISELFAEEFMKFEQYYYSPPSLTNPDNAGDIFKLEAILRDAVERLGITKFER